MRLKLSGLVAALMFVAMAAPLAPEAFSQTPAPGQAASPVDPAAVARARAARAKALETAIASEARTDPASLKTKGGTMAPAQVAAAGVPCTVADAKYLGRAAEVQYLEVACQDSMGYVISITGAPRPLVDDCLGALRTDGATACTLPGNANPHLTLQPMLTRAQNSCVPVGAEGRGRSATDAAYEVKCEGGSVVKLQVTLPVTDTSRNIAVNCFADIGKPNACTSITEAQIIANARATAGRSDNKCPVAKQRFVNMQGNGSGKEYLEFACADGTGFMVLSSLAGAVERTIPCTEATGIAGGCTLTDATAAIASRTNTMSQRVKTAGLDCEVTRTQNFPAPQNALEGFKAMEFSCSNRRDGGVLLTDAAGKDQVLNCVRAQADGYACGLTTRADAVVRLTAELKALGKVTCEIKDQRPVGNSVAYAFVEVSCKDGAPGFMIRYPRESGTPTDAFVCSTQTRTGGGCKLAGNPKLVE